MRKSTKVNRQEREFRLSNSSATDNTRRKVWVKFEKKEYVIYNFIYNTINYLCDLIKYNIIFILYIYGNLKKNIFYISYIIYIVILQILTN